MLLHEFGIKNNKTIVMIHGLAMSYDMLLPAVNELTKRNWHVFAVAVPGMDMDTDNEFTSVEEISEQIENALKAKRINKVSCLYGLSMGGGIALRMLADNKIHFDMAIIDAGITPYEMPYIATRFILLSDVLSTLLGKASKQLLELAFPPEKYTESVVRRMYEVMNHMTFRTIWRAYDSTDNYSMPLSFPKINTHIAYWYGTNEKKARKLDIKYVKKHIPNIHINKVPGMSHGEYVIAYPKEFAVSIDKGLKRVIF